MLVRGVVLTNEPPPVDRRSHTRRAARVNVEVLLAHEGLALTRCELRDISPDGAFVETKDFALAKGTHVEVVLRISRGGQFTHCRLPAEVVRVEGDGAALMFGKVDERAYTVLLEIVYPD